MLPIMARNDITETATRTLSKYFERSHDPRPVFAVYDGENGPLVDWSTSKRAAMRSKRTWEPTVKRITSLKAANA